MQWVQWHSPTDPFFYDKFHWILVWKIYLEQFWYPANWFDSIESEGYNLMQQNKYYVPTKIGSITSFV